MKIQSVSICCPAKKCINHCATCTARQHEDNYFDKYSSMKKCDTFQYWEDVILRLEHIRHKGCDTIMLTGSNEPQQNRRWLESLFLAMKILPDPYPNIEMQTTGAFINKDYVEYLKACGLTTLAISTYNIFDDEVNQAIEVCADNNLCLADLCENAYNANLNIRLCINVTDFVSAGLNVEDPRDCVEKILDRCAELHASQVTFRKMWCREGTPEARWISEFCKHDEEILKTVKEIVRAKGILLKTLPYGAGLYEYKGFTIVIDTDSMAKRANETALKYAIIREDGKAYSSWDDEKSLIF